MKQLFEIKGDKFIYTYKKGGEEKKVECDDLHKLILYAIRKP